MPTAKQTLCINGKDLVPQTQSQNDKCRMLESTTDGGTMTSQGKVVYHGNNFSGSFVTTGSQIPSAMTQKMTGRRIGDCK